MNTETIKNVVNALSENEKKLLKQIYEPKVTGVLLEDAINSFTVMPDGEIRYYAMINCKQIHADGDLVYLSSKDCGLSWKIVFYNENALGSSVFCPYNQKYMSFCFTEHNGICATYLKEAHSPDDENIIYKKISDEKITVTRPLLMLKKIKRILAIGQLYDENNVITPIICYSDDCGETWSHSLLNHAPKHEVKYPHKGLRWQNYSCEPTVCELDDKLMAIVRTSTDYHYVSYSYDFGASWTPVKKTTFHSTLTMPTLKRLNDGSIAFCWCNTQPLPKLDHKSEQPEIDEYEASGYWEDVFTNRDSAHLSISHDNAETWLGFREIHLNPIRNNCDFRSFGGILDGRDKSVHQSEIIELPFNKLLIASGQHSASARFIIVDRDWLEDKKRYEDFRCGLSNISTQVYLKSLSGCFRHFSGHCAWNRTNGAVLMAAPEIADEEALFICTTNDKRLFSNIQGAVWNFAARDAGEIETYIKISGNGLVISLTDRWINPIDTYVKECTQFSFILDKNDISDKWTKINIKFNISESKADVFADDKLLKTVSMRFTAPNGISYIHFQSAKDECDFDGAYIKYLMAF